MNRQILQTTTGRGISMALRLLLMRNIPVKTWRFRSRAFWVRTIGGFALPCSVN
jgi:hypothetical protein